MNWKTEDQSEKNRKNRWQLRFSYEKFILIPFFSSVNRQSIPLVVGNLILEQLYFSHFLVHGSFEKREFSDFDTIERESRRLYLFWPPKWLKLVLTDSIRWWKFYSDCFKHQYCLKNISKSRMINFVWFDFMISIIFLSFFLSTS